VVEHASARLHEPRHLPRVDVDLVRANVLDHPDAGHRVERLSRELAVVHHPNVHPLAESALLGTPAREGGLRLRERDAHHLDVVVRGGVHREAAPAAAHVQHALARLERELLADQLELCLLGLLQRRGPLREQGAAVGHRVTEHQPEEVVRDVVVVSHRAGVALGAVAAPARTQLRLRHGGRPDEAAGPKRGESEPRLCAPVERRRFPAVEQLEYFVEVVYGQLARHIRAAEPQLSRGPQRVRQRLRRAHAEGGPAAVRGGQPRAVPELHYERARWQRALEPFDQRPGIRKHGGAHGTVRGMQSIFPVLKYDDARAAIEFLEAAFGFERHAVYDGEDGGVAHAELRLGDEYVMLGSTSEGTTASARERVAIRSTWWSMTRTPILRAPRRPARRLSASSRTRTTARATTQLATRRATSGASAPTARRRARRRPGSAPGGARAGRRGRRHRDSA